MFSIGKIVSSFSGFANGGVNLAFRTFADDYTDFNAAYANKGVDAAANKLLGKELGKWFKKFLQVAFPDSQITLSTGNNN